MAKRDVGGYSGLQIGLHWAVVLLILFQFLAHEGMEHTYHAGHRGETPDAFDVFMANLHIVAGLLVLLFALTRLWLRLTRGAPKPPQDQPALIRFAARASHVLLYLLIILMPVSGISAWFLGLEPAGVAHGLMFNLLLAVIALHIAGALYEHFIARTDVLKRMTKPEGAT